VVLLSRNEAYDVRDLVIVAPLTSRVRRIASEVTLGTADGLPRACVANLDIITTVPKALLTRRLTALSTERVAAVDRALRFALGLL
jgi:mRNA interferase MazF